MAAMYKEYTQLEGMKVMGELNQVHKIDKIKTERESKREDMRIWTTLEVLHNQIRCILADNFPGNFFHRPHH